MATLAEIAVALEAVQSTETRRVESLGVAGARKEAYDTAHAEAEAAKAAAEQAVSTLKTMVSEYQTPGGAVP